MACFLLCLFLRGVNRGWLSQIQCRQRDLIIVLESLNIILGVWVHMIIGTLLLLIGTGVGLVIGKVNTFIPVRWVAWWVSRVIIPLLQKRFWILRSTTIFMNNIIILALIVAIGYSSYAAIVGISIVGFSMGIALKVLSDQPESFSISHTTMAGSNLRKFRIGIILNLLEPPAIVATLGLSLGRAVIPLNPHQTWGSFWQWIIPAMLIAAGGEALWIGVSLKVRDQEQESLS